jgi:hypothetical protein
VGPTDHSVGLGGGVGSTFFSGAVHPSNPVDDSLKIATYGDCPQEAYTGHTWIDVESVHIVLVGFFPCRVYIDSNRRVSRI